MLGTSAEVDLDAALDLMPLGACVITADLNVVFWNRSLAEWTGIAKDDALGMNLGDRYADLRGPRYRRRLAEVFESGRPAVFSAAIHKHFLPLPAPGGGTPAEGRMIQQTQVRLLSPSSPYALVTIQDVTSEALQLKALRGERAQLVQLHRRIVEANDELERRVLSRTEELDRANQSLQAEVAERRRVEDELRQGSRRYRFLADVMPAIVWTATPDGEPDYLNRRWYDFTGLTVADSEGPGWPRAIHPDDRSRCLDLWSASIRSGEPHEVEIRLRRADGAYRWHLGRAVPLRDPEGRIVQWFGACTDIDDHIRAEVELREAHDGLERRVSERTARLAETNGALEAEIAERCRAEERLMRYAEDVEEARSRIEQQAVELTEQTFALSDARLRAEAANHAKGEFLANMSHEIRTPINGVIGMTAAVLDTPMSAEQREFVEMIRISADSLLTLVNDILDYSKMEAGKLELDPTEFGLAEVVAASLAPLSFRAIEKRLTLVFRIAPDVPERIFGDPDRLRQILINLVGNGIKFTAEGGVAVSISLDPSSPGSRPPSIDGGAAIPLHFTVSDTGIGIPPDKIEAIFRPFEQADGSITRTFGGTGLGLTISTRLIEMMGGRIWVESEPGRGSTFHFTARFDHPRSIDRPGPPSPGPASAVVVRPRAARPLRILLAEDNLINQKVATNLLGKLGHETTVVGDGRQALAALALGGFDLVLMDVQMPELDGFEAVAEIRALEAESGSHQPVVALTAHAMKGYLERCLEGGFDGYLSKPIRIEELTRAIEAHARPRDLEHVRAQPAPSRPGEDVEPFDRAVALTCTGGDESLFAEVAAVYLEEFPRQLAEIGAALGDAPALTRAAHALKGASASFSATAVVEACDALETMGRDGDLTLAEAAFARLQAAATCFGLALSGSVSD